MALASHEQDSSSESRTAEVGSRTAEVGGRRQRWAAGWFDGALIRSDRCPAARTAGGPLGPIDCWPVRCRLGWPAHPVGCRPGALPARCAGGPLNRWAGGPLDRWVCRPGALMPRSIDGLLTRRPRSPAGGWWAAGPHGSGLIRSIGPPVVQAETSRPARRRASHWRSTTDRPGFGCPPTARTPSRTRRSSDGPVSAPRSGH
jgi:hypothetical protein